MFAFVIYEHLTYRMDLVSKFAFLKSLSSLESLSFLERICILLKISWFVAN